MESAAYHDKKSKGLQLGMAVAIASELLLGSPTPTSAQTVSRESSATFQLSKELSDTDWLTVNGVDTSKPLTLSGPNKQHIALGARDGSHVVVVDSQQKTLEAEAKIGDVDGLVDLQVVYKSKPSIASRIPNGFNVPVVGCHSGPGWPCDQLKNAHIGETWLINNHAFKVAQYSSMDFRLWNNARGMYKPGDHPYFPNGEMFFKLFGAKSLGFQPPAKPENYKGLVITSCEKGYVGGEIGYKEKFAVLFEPIKP